MDKALTLLEAILLRRVDEVLHYRWDPIGVSDAPEARNEYARYVPQVFALLQSGADASRIASFLMEIITERMGMTPNQQLSIGAANVAAELIDWKDFVFERHA